MRRRTSWRFISAAGECVEHVVKGAPVPTQSPTRFGEPYGEDAAYIAALAAAYRDFAGRILAERAGKAYESQCVEVDAALRVATFNDLAARSLTPLSDDAVVKWVPFRVPKVELLS